MNVAIIQARMGSTRLPNKVLMTLADKTVLEHVVDRVKRSKFVNEVIVATTVSKEDLKIVEFCSHRGIRIFVGSEQDVLDRYYQAAKLLQPDHVIRITSDCPMIDPDIIDFIGDQHLSKKSDYTSNTLEETYPDGLDAEIMTFKSLEQAWTEAVLPSEREHVTPYIKKHPEKFKLTSVTNEYNLSHLRWTIDQSEDYIFLKEVFEKLYPMNSAFTTGDVLKEISSNPNLLKINNNIVRNEGYIKSLSND